MFTILHCYIRKIGAQKASEVNDRKDIQKSGSYLRKPCKLVGFIVVVQKNRFDSVPSVTQNRGRRQKVSHQHGGMLAMQTLI